MASGRPPAWRTRPTAAYAPAMAAAPVTVRLFAALRDAAGTDEVLVDSPTSVAAVREALVDRFGPRFAERLSIAAVMVDGRPADPGSRAVLEPGAEVAMLPPFAGG